MKITVLQFEVRDALAVVTMHNPPVNALTPAFLEDFRKVLERLQKDHEIRALMLTSDCPGFFSAGDDLNSLTQIDEELIALLPEAHEVLNALESLPIPTVAAINGHALGGGLELAMVCDFRLMGDESGRIGLPEVRLGMIPALGGTQRLPILIGKAKAVEMMYKGLQILPNEALDIGLVNQVVPQAELHDKALDYTRRLALQATGAIAGIKASIHAGIYKGSRQGFETEMAAFRENIFSTDVREGVDAFLNGRKPQFSGGRRK